MISSTFLDHGCTLESTGETKNADAQAPPQTNEESLEFDPALGF